MSDTIETPAPPAGEAALVLDAATLERELQAWIAAQINDSPISRATEAWNHLITTALPDLKQRLTGART